MSQETTLMAALIAFLVIMAGGYMVLKATEDPKYSGKLLLPGIILLFLGVAMMILSVVAMVA